MEVQTPVPSGDDGPGDSSLIRYLETRFPLELFLHLTGFMDDSSIQNLRLVSRGLERALLPTFQRRFFAKRHICQNEHSLRRAAAISDHPRFGAHISSVSVGCIHGPSDIENADNAVFIDCGYDVEFLTHAFTNMSGLQDITIHRRPIPLARDNPRKLLRQLLHALSKAGRELQSFDMEIEGGGTGGGFSLSDLHLSDSLFEHLSRPLRSLRRLSLAIDPRPWPGRQDEPNIEPQLMRFLEIPRELEHLRLNLDRDAPLSTATILKSLTLEAPSSLLHLTRLDLGKMTTTVDTLVELVRVAAKPLVRLQFYRIGLKFSPNQDYPPDYFPEPTGDPPHLEAALWQMVFRELATMPELERLTQFSANYLTERLRKDHVAFRQELPGEKFEMRPGCEYTGVEARGFIKGLCENAVIRSPRPPLQVLWAPEDEELEVLSDGIEDNEDNEDDEGSDSE
ncbi:hypothetical protein VUR80DRAFT_5868 [Thermomyces stellatus]